MYHLSPSMSEPLRPTVRSKGAWQGCHFPALPVSARGGQKWGRDEAETRLTKPVFSLQPPPPALMAGSTRVFLPVFKKTLTPVCVCIVFRVVG